MPYANANEAKLYYRAEGQGNLLVLVHGSLGDYRDWKNQVEAFKSEFKVISYSRRNHYPNSWEDYPTNYSVLTERDDLVALLRELGEPVHLVGHSYGGYAAALVARDHPSHVKKLVLAEPPIFTLLNSGENLALVEKFLISVIEPSKKKLQDNDLESGIKTFLDGISGLNGVFDRLKPAFRSVMLDNARTAFPEIGISPGRDPFDCADASHISVPTLLVRGEQSPKVLQAVIARLADCMPNNQVETIPGASHGMIWDNARDFNDKALQFLK